MKQIIVLGIILKLISGPGLIAQIDEGVLFNSFEEVLAQVVEIRGLETLAPVKKGIRSKAEIKQYILDRFEEEYPPEELRTESQVLKWLALIPQEMDLQEFMIRFYTEQIAGLYDPYQQEFFIADWIPLEMQKPVMAHELTHALQDQHFGLKKFITRIPGNDDKLMARAALVEGEALLVMLEYSLRPLGRSVFDLPDIRAMTESQRSIMEAQFPVFASAPKYLQETSLFPYTYGASFLSYFIKTRKWSDLEAIYQRLPESTEQIIHPEKYFERPDPPTIVGNDRNRITGLSVADLPSYSNVLGEFSLYLLLENFLAHEQAQKAARGWDGDRVQFFEKDGSESGGVLHLETIWDSETDALEFFEAYSQLIPLKFSSIEAQDSEDPSSIRRWKSRDDSVILQRSKLEVSILEIRE